jgi:hypothetical protein
MLYEREKRKETEMSNNAVVDNEREPEAREAQAKQHASNNQEAWDRYVDARIEWHLNSRRADVSTDTLPDALHEALGQVLAEERRQWRRERELIQSEAQRVISDLRAVIAELSSEIRERVASIKPGAAGAAGPPGPPGKLSIAKQFEPDKVNYEGDVVVHNGATYQALRDTGHDVSHADWICLAKAGRDGRDGSTPKVRGTYDVHERYAKLDIVALDGAAFIAKHDDPGICPGDGWQMMSRQGKAGRPGCPGERGPRGEKGDAGPPAVVPQLIGAKVDEKYNLIRVLSDGSKEVLPLRRAFEQFHQETDSE